jgi:hypothetical protein
MPHFLAMLFMRGKLVVNAQVTGPAHSPAMNRRLITRHHSETSLTIPREHTMSEYEYQNPTPEEQDDEVEGHTVEDVVTESSEAPGWCGIHQEH